MPREMAKLDPKAANDVVRPRVRSISMGRPRNSTTRETSCLPTARPSDFTAAAKKLDRAQQTQLLFDYSAEAFKSAIDIKPDYDFGNNNLGVYYARRGRPEDLKLAEKYFRGALVSNQRYADAFNNLAIVLARQGKYDEAILCHKLGWPCATTGPRTTTISAASTCRRAISTTPWQQNDRLP